LPLRELESNNTGQSMETQYKHLNTIKEEGILAEGGDNKRSIVQRGPRPHWL
jgi:hypothetical protein